ncbi:MAG: SNF2-related protein [Polyangiaceae bacterium]
MADSEALPLEETWEYLEDQAARRLREFPPEIITSHVIRITEGADFQVRRAAFEALVRRWQVAEDEGLVVVRNTRGSECGEYQTGRPAPASSSRVKFDARPYVTEIQSVDEFQGECSCPDFLSNSLATCKHLLTAFALVFKQRNKRGIPRRDAWLSHTNRSARDQVRLVWNPIIPLLGPIERLAGLRAEIGLRRMTPFGFTKTGELDSAVLASSEKRHEFLQFWAHALNLKKDRSWLVCGPATRKLIETELELANRSAQFSQASDDAIAALANFGRRLFPYQREAVERVLRTGRMLLADDMGLGKTTQAIAVCHALFEAGIVRRGLILTPATLKNQWLREWNDATHTPVTVVDGSAAQRSDIYSSFTRGFLILNYEILLRDFEQLAPLAGELVVLDEAQRIKNHATKSAVYVKALQPKRRLILTGTPMENNLDELASLLDWIDERALAPKWRVAPWFVLQESSASKMKVGMRHLDTLRARISSCVIRRSRKEVLTQLPSRTDTRVPVAMTELQITEHDERNQPIASLMRRSEHRPLKHEEFLKLMSLLTQQRIISNGLAQLNFEEVWPTLEKRAPSKALLDGLNTPKLDELRNLLRSVVIEQGRKVVVFSQWRRMLRLAAWAVDDLLHEADLRASFFTGAESSKVRTKSLIEFHDDPSSAVLFLTDAGGVGLNLQKAASACVNIDLPGTPQCSNSASVASTGWAKSNRSMCSI